MALTTGDKVTAAEAATLIFTRFMDLVYNPKAGPGLPPWHNAYYPWSVIAADLPKLGPQAITPPPTNPSSPPPILGNEINVASIANPSITAVFNAIHGFANQLTRIRMTDAYYNTNGTYNYVGSGSTALNTTYETTIPRPLDPSGLVQGEKVSLSSISPGGIDSFMTAMNTSLNSFAAERINCCHYSCHGSCHGSRGRR